MPTYAVPSHPGLLLVDPEVIIVSTLDLPRLQRYRPSIELVMGDHVRIHHDLPEQPYVDGTWTDADVSASVEAHLLTLLTTP